MIDVLCKANYWRIQEDSVINAQLSSIARIYQLNWKFFFEEVMWSIYMVYFQYKSVDTCQIYALRINF